MVPAEIKYIIIIIINKQLVMVNEYSHRAWKGSVLFEDLRDLVCEGKKGDLWDESLVEFVDAKIRAGCKKRSRLSISGQKREKYNG